MTTETKTRYRRDYDLAPYLAKGRQLRSAAMRNAVTAMVRRTKTLFNAVAIAGARKVH